MLLPRSIAVSIDTVARRTVGKDWGLYSLLLERWDEIVGTEYARHTTPVKLSFPKGKTTGDKWAQGKRTDGVLHIRAPKGLVMEMSFLTDQIRQRISACLGYEAVERLVFDPFYATVKSPSQSAQTPPDPAVVQRLKSDVQDIDDEELRAALLNLAQTVASCAHD